MELVLNQVISGLIRASILFIITSGLTLLFGVMGVLNMAHFSLYMVGAYLTWSFSKIFMGYNFGFWIGCVFTLISMIIIGFIIERIIMRRLYNRILPEQLLATFALVYIFNDMVKIFWGLEYLSVTKPKILTYSISVLGNQFPSYYVFMLALGVVIAFGIWFLLFRTRFGRIVRACRSYKEIVGALGVPVPWIYTNVFIISVLLAGLGGAAWTTIGVASLGLDQSLLIESFCVMVMGGMGSFLGTAVASLICGEVYSFGILFVPRIATLLIFIVTGIVISVRPWGLFGTKGRLH